MFGKIIWSAIFIAAGLGLVVYTEKIKNFVGNVDFAEKWFGSGGTYSFLKLLGVLIIIGSFLWLTGTLDRLVPGFLVNSGISAK